jgi:Kinesin motor domain
LANTCFTKRCLGTTAHCSRTARQVCAHAAACLDAWVWMLSEFAGRVACVRRRTATSSVRELTRFVLRPGSGKTHTLFGNDAEAGLVPLLAEELLHRLTCSPANTSWKVDCSFVEIYNERVRDLLVPARLAPPGGLRVREDPVRGPYVEGLTVRPVPDFAAFRAVLEEGSRERTVATTACNATSSRAHTIVQLTVTRSSPGPGGEIRERVSKIDLVDLAGSERVAATGARGRRLEEGASINKSLSALGNCIRALSDMQAKAKKAASASTDTRALFPAVSVGDASAAPAHIPFRDSVLTWLLKSSLGGNSKTALVAAVSPGEADHDETLSTLRFADRMQRVETVAVVNEGRRIVAPAASGQDDMNGVAGQRASNTGSERPLRGSLTPPRADSLGAGPAAGVLGGDAMGIGSCTGDLTAAALRNYRHQRAAAHKRPPRLTASRRTNSGSGGGGSGDHVPMTSGDCDGPVATSSNTLQAPRAAGMGSSTRMIWDTGRLVVNSLPPGGGSSAHAARAGGAAPVGAIKLQVSPFAASTRRSPSPQRSSSFPAAASSTSPAPKLRRVAPAPARAGGNAPSRAAAAPAGAALSTSPLKQRAGAPTLLAPRKTDNGTKQQTPAPSAPPPALQPPPPPVSPPVAALARSSGGAAASKSTHGRPSPLQLPTSLSPTSSVDGLTSSAVVAPNMLWHLPAYPPTPSHISLPDGDSPSTHAWAPLPPGDGELPRWDTPLTPVRQSSNLGALNPVSAAAAASAVVAAVEEARRMSSGIALPPSGLVHITI